MHGSEARRLEDAFETFNRLSANLTRSYEALQARVAQLTAELAEARSERLRQLAEKERLANRLAQLLDALPAGVLLLDERGRVREANPAARSLFGADIEGRPWLELAGRLVPEGQGFRLPDDRRVSLTHRTLDDGGRILLLTDETENHRLEAMLNRNRRLAAMGEMSARLAHQIRTPLASVLLYLSQLEDRAMDEDRRRLFVDRSRERLAHLERLIDNMLAWARGGEVPSETFAVERLVDDFAQVMAPQLELRGGRLTIEGDCQARLRGDQRALLGALVNLGMNALQACDGPPRLKLQVSTDTRRVYLRLADNGRGMSPEVLAHAFEPFYTTRSEGTGLGLAVVRTVVEAHQGTIRLESTPGQGTQAEITLPRIDQETAS